MENPDVVVDADKMLVLSTGLPVDVPYKLEDLLAQLEKKGTETSLVLPSEKTMNILKDFNYNMVEAKIRPLLLKQVVNKDKLSCSDKRTLVIIHFF